jgi:hypothetical protein
VNPHQQPLMLNRYVVVDGKAYRYTGMEPWFQFWKAVRYAIKQFKIEWANHNAYMRTGGAS